MPYFDRLEFPRKHPISVNIKFILLIIIVLAIIGRNLWLSYQRNTIVITDINLLENSRTTADIEFTVVNKAGYMQKREFLLKVFDQEDKEVGSKILRLELQESSIQRYRKVLSRLTRTLGEEEKLKRAEVKLYTPSIF
jgi:hypothetical protein